MYMYIHLLKLGKESTARYCDWTCDDIALLVKSQPVVPLNGVRKTTALDERKYLNDLLNGMSPAFCT